MDVKYLEKISNLTIGDILSLFPVMKMPMKEAMPIMREFRDKHGLTDKDVLVAASLTDKLRR